LKNDSWIKIEEYTEEINFEELWKLHPENPTQIKIYGKLTDTPRLTTSYLNSYKYSGQESKKAEKFPGILQKIKKYVDEELGFGEFDQVLVNWYRDGNDYIGTHSDDEKQLKTNSEIVTISFVEKGAERKFRIRDMDKKIIKDIMTTNGKILTMGGTMQKFYKHEIVKINGEKGKKVGKRISITLRKFK
jgi:alkylated DNA repair dioxygenase AlkB